MNTKVSRQFLSLLALLGSSAGMAATVTISASTLAPSVGDIFTLTVQSDVEDSLAATMLVAFDDTKVSWLSGAVPASWSLLGEPMAVLTSRTPRTRRRVCSTS